MVFGSYRFIRIAHIRPTSRLKSPLETLRKIEFGSRLESLAKISLMNIQEKTLNRPKNFFFFKKVKWTSFTEFYGLLKSRTQK